MSSEHFPQRKHLRHSAPPEPKSEPGKRTAGPPQNRRKTSIVIEIRVDAAKAIAATGGAVALIIAAANGLPFHFPF
jgi:hypothetical protein